MFNGSINARDHVLTFGGVTHVMGVINVSPESKNPHTVATSVDEALGLARRYREWGANLVDVGGQSSHIDNPTIAAEEEIARLAPVVEALTGDGFVVSVDTWKPEVAAAAIASGAAIVNDTGGMGSPEMRRAVTGTGVAVVAVHVDGKNPHDVDEVRHDDDKAGLIAERFRRLMEDLEPDVAERLIVDPGVAINYRGDYTAYTRLQMEVIRRTPDLAALGRPVLVPIPRKRDIHWVTAYVTLALEYGADMIRVHDVPLAVELTRLFGRRVEGG